MATIRFYRLLLILIIINFWNTNLKAQSYLDSLKHRIDNSNNDTLKLRLLIEYSDYCEVVDIPVYTKSAIDLANKLLSENKYNHSTILRQKAMANNNNGYYHHYIGDHRESIKYYTISLEEFTKVPDSSYMSLVYNNLAMVYNDIGNIDTVLVLLTMAEDICISKGYDETLLQTYSNLAVFYNKYGDYEKSIQYSSKIIDIQTGFDDIDGIVHAYNNISSIYYTQKDYLKAEEFILKALEYEDRITTNESLATYYYNLSTIQYKLNKDSLSLINMLISLDISRNTNHIKGLGDCYKQLSGNYLDKNELSKALIYSDSAHSIYSGLNYIEGLSSVTKNKAHIFLKMKDYTKAKSHGLMSLNYANKLGYPDDIKHASEVLYKIYEKTDDYKNAFEMLELYHFMKDSLERTDKINETYKLQIDFEYNQKTFTDSLQGAIEKEVVQLKLNEKNAQLEKEQTRNTSLVIGLILVLGSVIFIIRAYNKKKELAITISRQKEEVEQKNKEITDSINYASKIQHAILTSKSYINSILDDYFMIYKPKDIVSGDFYWIHKTENNKLIVAIVDCTGHGVPGAFMSMIGNSLLNKIIIENKIDQPAEILNKLRAGVIKALSKSGSNNGQRDGMDISLMVWNQISNKIEFSGANNPLWIVTNIENTAHIPETKKSIHKENNLTLIELKPNKFPIGLYIGKPKPFDSTHYQLAKGDSIYMGTDGFADQFGGKKNKKYKSKTLKSFITSINHLPFNEQNKSLNTEFTNWMADNEQLDDVCNFGCKVT